MTDVRPATAEPYVSITPTPRRVITVSHGTATGPTKLAAFDEALLIAGIGNFNLIHLSSIIPPNSTVRSIEGRADLVGGWGDRFYVILAEGRIDTPHEEIWAGLGWVQEEATGQGLFVEHVGHGEAQVLADIQSSLTSMVAARPQIHFGDLHWAVHGATCVDEPVCTLVAAALESSPWPPEVHIVLP